MKHIEFTNPHRKKHFDFFRGMGNPHFNSTAEVDISSLLPYLKVNNLPTNIAIAYLISRAANEIPEFRWRIRNDKVIEHPFVSPSFTVSTEVADVFGFCTVTYGQEPKIFMANALKQRELNYHRLKTDGFGFCLKATKGLSRIANRLAQS